MEYEIGIERVNNGFIVSWLEDGEAKSLVFEDDEILGELFAMQNALYQVIEHFGLFGSKHDDRRLRVDVVERG